MTKPKQIKKVISGGQTGADRGALRAAFKLGIETGGWIPKGCLTETGPDPSLISHYGCKEHSSSKYPPRTFANVRDSDATIRFAKDFSSAGERCTLKAIQQYGKPFLDVLILELDVFTLGLHGSVNPVRRWLNEHNVKVLNVAGNRESTCPGIELLVYRFMGKVLGEDPPTKRKRK